MDPSPPPSPTHAERCRTLVAEARTATLATLAREPAGFPFASLVSVAGDDDGRPLLLLSTLAEHTRNLLEHAEASLLCCEPVPEGVDPLALGRVTVLGRCARVEGVDLAAARTRFLEVHPEAQAYVGFGDFALFRLQPEALRFVGGFGRMSWVGADGYRAAQPDPLRQAAADIIAHMNADHGLALVDIARVACRLADATGARMLRVDRYGFEMVVERPEASGPQRVAFAHPADTPQAVRGELIALVKAARAVTAPGA